MEALIQIMYAFVLYSGAEKVSVSTLICFVLFFTLRTSGVSDSIIRMARHPIIHYDATPPRFKLSFQYRL
jgi:hypothetical protein